MKHTHKTIASAVLLMIITSPVLGFVGSVSAQTAVGSGTTEDPYMIATASDLEAAANDNSGTFENHTTYALANDIDASSLTWNTYLNAKTLEGNGYAINGLILGTGNNHGDTWIKSSQLNNVEINNASVVGGSDAALMGLNVGVNDVTVRNSYIEGGVPTISEGVGVGDTSIKDVLVRDTEFVSSGTSEAPYLLMRAFGGTSLDDVYFSNITHNNGYTDFIERTLEPVGTISTLPSAVLDDQSMMVGSPIVFDASQSIVLPEYDGTETYTWTINGETVSSDSSTVQITHRTDGNHDLQLTVTSPEGSDTVTMTYFVDDVPLENLRNEFAQDSLDYSAITEFDESGGDITKRITVDQNGNRYTGVLVTDTTPVNGSFTVGNSYTVGTNETAVLVVDEQLKNESLSQIAVNTISLSSGDMYTLVDAVDRETGDSVTEVLWQDYTDDTTLMTDVASYTGTAVPPTNGEDTDTDTSVTPIGELSDTDKILMIGLFGGIFLVLIARKE